MDALTGGKTISPAGNLDELIELASNVDLDASKTHVVERFVRETREIEIAAEITIYPAQEIQVEGGGDTRSIVIGRVETSLVLFHIDADQQSTPASHQD